MNNDLDIIVKQFPVEQNELHVYALGDLHVGSEQFNEKAVKKKIDIIKNDDLGCVVLLGDLGDFGLKNSKTNVYRQTMNSQEQILYIVDLLDCIKDKIAAAVSGNHEERLVRETSVDPTLTITCRLGCENVYRENMAITKYVFGSVKGNTTGKVQQNVFYGLAVHGTTRNKNHIFQLNVEGCDFGWSAHVHTPSYSQHGRIRVNRGNGTAVHVPYKEIVVDANLSVGGYGVKHQYEIPPPPELQYLELKTYRDSDKRNTHRIINFHTITIE